MEQNFRPDISGASRLVLLTADPVAHLSGFSAYNRRLNELGGSAFMAPAHIPSGKLADALVGLRRMENLLGLILSLPHKQDALLAADTASLEAKIAGAANLLVRKSDGTLHAEAFDGLGMIRALDEAEISVAQKAVVIAGAGGAARLVAMEIARRGPAKLKIVNRTKAKADTIATLLSREHPGVYVATAAKQREPADVLINCTSLGLKPDDPLVYSEDVIAGSPAVVDAIIRETKLVRKARELGVEKVMGGEPMMRQQIDIMCRTLLGLTVDQPV